jgi:hypothetical protein
MLDIADTMNIMIIKNASLTYQQKESNHGKQMFEMWTRVDGTNRKTKGVPCLQIVPMEQTEERGQKIMGIFPKLPK